MKITAVVVTRGDRDISQVTESLKHFDELIVWDNSKALKDLKVFGRYAGAYIARNNLVYVQDDDCLIDSKRLSIIYEKVPYRGNVCSNFPCDRRVEYAGTRITLLGWGSIFCKSALPVFDVYLEKFPFDDLFLRECDRVFSFLSYVEVTDIGVQHVDYAHGDDRMGREPRHREDFLEIRRRLAAL